MYRFAQRLSDSALFGLLFALPPSLAHAITGCFSAGSCSAGLGRMDPGIPISFLASGLIGWMLFAAPGRRQSWGRAATLGFVAALAALFVYWAWLSLVRAPDPGGFDIPTFIYVVLVFVVPFMPPVAIVAASLVRRQALGQVVPAPARPRRAIAGEGVGYSIAIWCALLFLSLAFDGRLDFHMADRRALWLAAFLCPILAWVCVFRERHRPDLPGLALVAVASYVFVTLVAVSVPAFRAGIPFPSDWTVLGRALYWGLDNLRESGPIIVPAFLVVTLAYGHYVNWQRQGESIDR